MMMEYHNSRPARIIGPGQEVLTRDNLPAPDTTRWVASRKAKVVAAVEAGLISIEEVLARYNLSHEEYYGWQRAMDRAGVAGLRVCWTQKDRARRAQQLREGRSGADRRVPPEMAIAGSAADRRMPPPESLRRNPERAAPKLELV